MAKKNSGKKGAEKGAVSLEQSNALDEKGSHVFPDAPQAPSGSPETATTMSEGTVAENVEAAPSGSEEPTAAPKRGGKKGGAKPAKNVNPRRVIAPKPGAKGAKGAKSDSAPAGPESVKATPDAPKRGRGRPRKDGLPPGTELAVEPFRLTDEKRERFRYIKERAHTLKDGFFEFSTLLLEVAEDKLYLEEHKTFSEFVEAEFQIKGRLGWYNVAAASVNRTLASQGVTNLPKNEGQARALAALQKEPEKLVQAWEVANEIAASEGKEEPTREHSARAVARVTGKPEPTHEQPASQSTPAPALSTSAPVEAAKANGTIPANSEVISEEVEDGEDTESETIAPSIADIEMRDDKWLAQFPLDSVLKGLPLKRFRAAALAYRWMAGARVHFVRSVLTPLVKEAKRESGVRELDPYLHRVRYGLTAPAPDKWVACDVCNHTGQVPTIGKCTACHGAAFIVPVR